MHFETYRYSDISRIEYYSSFVSRRANYCERRTNSIVKPISYNDKTTKAYCASASRQHQSLLCHSNEANIYTHKEQHQHQSRPPLHLPVTLYHRLDFRLIDLLMQRSRQTNSSAHRYNSVDKTTTHLNPTTFSNRLPSKLRSASRSNSFSMKGLNGPSVIPAASCRSAQSSSVSSLTSSTTCSKFSFA